MPKSDRLTIFRPVHGNLFYVDNIIEDCPALAVKNPDDNAESVLCEGVEHLDAEKTAILSSDVVNADICEIDTLEVYDVVQSSQSKENLKHIKSKKKITLKLMELLRLIMESNLSGNGNQMEL